MCFVLGSLFELLVSSRRAPTLPATTSPIEISKSASENEMCERTLLELRREINAQVLRIDDHGTRLHDLEILNRAQCK
jgi:hypothetical protein